MTSLDNVLGGRWQVGAGLSALSLEPRARPRTGHSALLQIHAHNCSTPVPQARFAPGAEAPLAIVTSLGPRTTQKSAKKTQQVLTRGYFDGILAGFACKKA